MHPKWHGSTIKKIKSKNLKSKKIEHRAERKKVYGGVFLVGACLLFSEVPCRPTTPHLKNPQKGQFFFSKIRPPPPSFET